MTGKYIFYDLETTGRGKKESATAFGTTPKWEQILQIAAIVTDENFQPTNQNINEFCRPRTSIISQPGALLTTQKGIRESLNAKLSSYELIKKINSTFDQWKKDNVDPVFIGHNIIDFDESVLEYNLFNNLFFPYITRKNRGDTLNLSRALYALNPSSIKTPLTARGNPSFKLDKLAELNNLPVEFAHDAFSDVKTSIALTKFIHDIDQENWKQLKMTMNKEKAIEYVNANKGFCYMTSFAGKVKLQALSMVCESQYSGWFHTIDLAHDPNPLLEANIEEFKKLIKKKNRYVICNQHPILLSGKIATNYEPYNELGAEILNERAKKVYQNKSLADKFKHMEIDRQIEKEDEASQDNIFPESKANMFTKFGQGDTLREFHESNTWAEKYQVALTIRDKRASFILKRLIFDESPSTLSDKDFKYVHRELHDRLVINQERPFTTIPEAMMQTDTELVDLEDGDDDLKEEKLRILKDYNTYLIFMEQYFKDKSSKPLKLGHELVKQIFD
jgi:exodeoxyribonuclease-1